MLVSVLNHISFFLQGEGSWRQKVTSDANVPDELLSGIS